MRPRIIFAADAAIALIYPLVCSLIPGFQWAFFIIVAALLVVYRVLKWYR